MTEQMPPANGDACCTSRATVVPIVALGIDIGLPVFLLLASHLYLRRSRLQGSPNNPHFALPLIQSREPPDATRIDSPLASAAVAGRPTPSPIGRICKIMRLGQLSSEQHTAQDVETRLVSLAIEDEQLLMQGLASQREGLAATEAASRLKRNGPAIYKETRGPSFLQMLWNAVMQPFNGLMAAVAILTICPPTKDTRTFTLIMILLTAAMLLRFKDEVKSSQIAKELLSTISTKTMVFRDGLRVKIDSCDTVVGDIVQLSGNDIVPADMRILSSQNLLVGMAALTGESNPVQRNDPVPSRSINVLDATNLVLQGSNVISGTAICVVLATGRDTYTGRIATSMSQGRQLNAFDFAVRRVVFLFIWFLVVMVPVVIVLSGFSTGPSPRNGKFTNIHCKRAALSDF